MSVSNSIISTEKYLRLLKLILSLIGLKRFLQFSKRSSASFSRHLSSLVFNRQFKLSDIIALRLHHLNTIFNIFSPSLSLRLHFSEFTLNSLSLHVLSLSPSNQFKIRIYLDQNIYILCSSFIRLKFSRCFNIKRQSWPGAGGNSLKRHQKYELLLIN